MKDKKRLIYIEDAISLLEKDIAENKDALQHAYHGDKEAIREEINGVRRVIHILKHHASHGGTVDAVEVVHARWVDVRELCGDYMCSNCKELSRTKTYNYCPNCSAKMDGERKE